MEPQRFSPSVGGAQSQLWEVLGDLDHLLSALSAEQFLAPPLAPRTDCPTGASAHRPGPIGAQIRHVLDHIRALLEANGAIDYSRRERETRIEKCPQQAQHEVRRLQKLISSNTFERDARVRVVDVAGCQDSLHRVCVDSTWHRELLFVISHSVHHLALVRVMAEAQGVALTRELGVAASSLALDVRERAQDKVSS